MKPTVISETPITLAEIKEELVKIKKRDGELNYRANKTEEYVAQFCETSVKEAGELQKKLEGLKITRLRDIHYNKLIDIQPKNSDEVKAVLQGYNITVSQENLKKIVGVFA